MGDDCIDGIQIFIRPIRSLKIVNQGHQNIEAVSITRTGRGAPKALNLRQRDAMTRLVSDWYD